MPSPNDRQKALTRAYLKTPKTMGAYCIRNIASGKCFVGVSRDIDARLNRHRFELKTKADKSSAELQRDWTELGADAFEFTVLDTIEPLDQPNYDPTDDLEMLEELWFKQVHTEGSFGYNTPPKA